MSQDHKPVSAVPTASDTTQTSKKSTKGVLCAKCEHVNKPGSTTCSVCRSHLHVKCKDCGAINERVLTTCRSCGRKLHRNAFQKLTATLSRSRSQFKPSFVILLLIIVAVVFYMVITLTHMPMPRLF
jgi:hypothetical protein